MTSPMMVERHYDDEALLTLMDGDRLGTDAHLPSCTVCSEKLHTYRTITGALRHQDVWDKAEVRRDPVPATIANLRAFADRMSFEDTAADAILPELLAGSREEWMPRLMAHPEWRTAGVVRGLVAETTRVVMLMPPDALELSALSTEIADHLDPQVVRADTIARLRGWAWRDRAYTLFYIGRYAESLAAAERAESSVQGCVVDEYDRGRIAIVRALSLRAKEDLSAAMESARDSATTFVRFADLNRLASARLAEVQILFSQGDYHTAADILEGLERQMRGSADASTHARVLGNLGYCHWRLGRIDEALRCHDASAKIHAAIGTLTEAVRIRWNVAAILASEGRFDEAMTRYGALKRTFDELSMTSESALVGLDMAEVLIVRGEFSAVEELCRAAMRSFEVAGVPYTARALTALAYIHEAAQSRKATPQLVKHVREYMRQLPDDAELLFAPPPPELF
ncbi:MAG: tetratricopeptide repeat protein [Thermoanaerobaculia bacterium]